MKYIDSPRIIKNSITVSKIMTNVTIKPAIVKMGRVGGV